ncbi:MAG TPA: 4a-hydroxytetrahydrobiopterin dehydratase [bacterium]|jgi:4a-hydroxytetrahydrobiopterin dehydratase|nr:4a-hydroxytetrahydrobiopterin dehydratase [bacterium]
MSDLAGQKCKPCEGGIKPLSEAEAQTYLSQLPGWQKINLEIVKTFTFKNYYETMAFVNAAAFIAHQEDHHPDMEVSYKTCKVRYTTHAIGGLSENDFICAAKVNALTSK